MSIHTQILETNAEKVVSLPVNGTVEFKKTPGAARGGMIACVEDGAIVVRYADGTTVRVADLPAAE